MWQQLGDKINTIGSSFMFPVTLVTASTSLVTKEVDAVVFLTTHGQQSFTFQRRKLITCFYTAQHLHPSLIVNENKDTY